jgi:uncharacterized membrane protein
MLPFQSHIPIFFTNNIIDLHKAEEYFVITGQGIYLSLEISLQVNYLFITFVLIQRIKI